MSSCISDRLKNGLPNTSNRPSFNRFKEWIEKSTSSSIWLFDTSKKVNFPNAEIPSGIALMLLFANFSTFRFPKPRMQDGNSPRLLSCKNSVCRWFNIDNSTGSRSIWLREISMIWSSPNSLIIFGIALKFCPLALRTLNLPQRSWRLGFLHSSTRARCLLIESGR